MKRHSLTFLLCFAMGLSSLGLCQVPTFAGLNRESVPDITHISSGRIDTTHRSQPGTTMAPPSSTSRLAARALFVNSDLRRARTLAKLAVRQNGRDAEAQFVRMEVAGIELDDAAMLEAAVRLCELGGAMSEDPRVQLAAVRLRESAANTPEFRRTVPRLQSLLADSSQHWSDLELALLNAAMDGVPGLDPYAASRAAGILTDWRIVGPLGRHPLLDSDPVLVADSDNLAQPSYKGRLVENFQYPDGHILLPDYLSARGTFYAASQFASLADANWTINAESRGALEIYVDGRLLVRDNSRVGGTLQRSINTELAAGLHRVLVSFAASSTPLKISAVEHTDRAHSPLQAGLTLQEATYQLAAQHYANGEFGSAIRQIKAVTASGDSAALQFLLAQAQDQQIPSTRDSNITWHRVLSLAPGALAADQQLAKKALSEDDLVGARKLANHLLKLRPTDAGALEILSKVVKQDPEAASEEAQLWTRRLAAHPSCIAALGASTFYRSQNVTSEIAAAELKLEGCAPESREYAEFLSRQGRHQEAAEELRRLLAAAPLQRNARQMLVRELQLSGQDAAAQSAAADWLRIAPNAENYHRLAAGSTDYPAGKQEFYLPYRRDATEAARESADKIFIGDAVVLLDDHVAIDRQDGSISLYVHTATRLLTVRGIEQIGGINPPKGAQLLQSRVLRSIDDKALSSTAAAAVKSLLPGDVVDQEYVVNYAGDGGIPEHSEAFQFVFGSFDRPVLSARFVALTPAEHADRGVVITTGEAPRMRTRIEDGMLARVWQKDALILGGDRLSKESPAIVRIVEQENGWSVPSNAEHQRKIETIHPGPRPQDTALPNYKKWPLRRTTSS